MNGPYLGLFSPKSIKGLEGKKQSDILLSIYKHRELTELGQHSNINHYNEWNGSSVVLLTE